MYNRLADFSLTKSAHSLRSFALTARFARSTGLSALRAIEHRGRVLNHGRACQRCDQYWEHREEHRHYFKHHDVEDEHRVHAEEVAELAPKLHLANARQRKDCEGELA